MSRRRVRPANCYRFCLLYYIFLLFCHAEHGGLAGTQFRSIGQTHADWRFDRVQTGAVDQASSVLPRTASRSEYLHRGVLFSSIVMP